MTVEQIENYLSYNEAVKCAYNNHQDHSHPTNEEITDDENNSNEI